MSELEDLRRKYKPELPSSLKSLKQYHFTPSQTKPQIEKEIQAKFPHTHEQKILKLKKEKLKSSPLKIGVVFSGGQAPGGHNVISGLFDALKKLHPKSGLVGFLGGPIGIVENKKKTITKQLLAKYRNVGGFDLIASGRTKIETKEQLDASCETVKKCQLDGLVIIGGDDSNTNAAVLAEYFIEHQIKTRVIGVPKTIDGDLRNKYIEMSFGFDTASKTYAEMIGNISKDALSARKYWHFIKLMGRSASHITLECAFKTHPNIALIGEEVLAKKQTLKHLIDDLVFLIEKRGKNYGVALIPEGLIEFLVDMKELIKELNQKLTHESNLDKKMVLGQLSQTNRETFEFLPEKIQTQLLLDRDPHGNVKVSQIETEALLIELIKKKLKEKNSKIKFSPLQHFFGYEGRAAFPSNFDANYCYALGHIAALLIASNQTGYIACLQNLKKTVQFWTPLAIPITMLMHIEERHGKPKPVIEKYLVDLKGKAFKEFSKKRQSWALKDDYQNPGPIQYYGSKLVTDRVPFLLN